MFRYKSFALTLASMLLLASTLHPTPVVANTASGSSIVESETPETNPILMTILEILGLDDVFRDLVENWTPNIEVITEAIETGEETSAEAQSKIFENKPYGSSAISNDVIEQATRGAIANSINATTTSAAARSASQELIVGASSAIQNTKSLATNSATSDVSQQILQNLSEQASINGELLGTIAIQNAQAQNDRANQIMLDLQQAKHAAGENALKRRQNALATNRASQGWVMLNSPIYIYDPD